MGRNGDGDRDARSPGEDRLAVPRLRPRTHGPSPRTAPRRGWQRPHGAVSSLPRRPLSLSGLTHSLTDSRSLNRRVPEPGSPNLRSVGDQPPGEARDRPCQPERRAAPRAASRTPSRSELRAQSRNRRYGRSVVLKRTPRSRRALGARRDARAEVTDVRAAPGLRVMALTPRRRVHLHSRPHIDLQRVAGALCRP
ncbi:putative leader peptide [Streptomyces fagopyri]